MPINPTQMKYGVAQTGPTKAPSTPGVSRLVKQQPLHNPNVPTPTIPQECGLVKPVLGSSVQFAHVGPINAPGVGVGVADYEVDIPSWGNQLIVASVTADEVVGISFKQLGRTNPTGVPTYLGTEEWLQLFPGTSAGTPAGSSLLNRGFEFVDPIPNKIYLFISNSTGWTTFSMTFMIRGIKRLFQGMNID
jgi:hypothetical protein